MTDRAFSPVAHAGRDSDDELGRWVLVFWSNRRRSRWQWLDWRHMAVFCQLTVWLTRQVNYHARHWGEHPDKEDEIVMEEDCLVELVPAA